jgi:arylsulfatase A-like enzyme
VTDPSTLLRRIVDSRWLYFSLAGLLVGIGVFSVVDVHLPSRPVRSIDALAELRDRDDINVVFILIDTLRADRLGVYGYERDTSPVMDFLASSGIVFADVLSQSSWTKASMASLWSSSYPRRVDVRRFPDGLSEELLLPAEILSGAGFFTGGIFRNGWIAANFGFGQGFDVYIGARTSVTPRKLASRNPSAHALTGSDWDVTEGALAFLESRGHARFFLYLHYMDVHQYTYDQDSAKFGSDLPDAYDNALLWTDRNVSVLVRALDDRDLLAKTLLVLASDHGEAFREHGSEGHGRNLYGEVVRTPLILILPFRLEPGVVVEEAVENVDIWPTILDLLGLETPAGVDGRSLVPLIEAAARGIGPATEGGRPRFSELDKGWGVKTRQSEPLVAITRGRYRLIDNRAFPEASELYDVEADPTEQRNLARHRPEVVAELRAEVDRLVEAEKLVEAPTVELDELRRAQLMALGYVVPR